jgi:hypothetical protein
MPMVSPSLTDEREGNCAAERLGDAGDAQRIVGGDGGPGRHVSDAGGNHLQSAVTLDDGYGARRPARNGDELVECAGERIG